MAFAGAKRRGEPAEAAGDLSLDRRSGRASVEESVAHGSVVGVDAASALSAGRVASLGAGNGAVSAAIQRAVVAAERDWLRAILSSRDSGFIARTVANSPHLRLLRMAAADRNETIEAVRGEVDGFEVALGAAFGYDHERSCRFVSVLEAGRPNEALAARLMTLFRSSVDPLIGLGILIGLDFDRTRALLQSPGGLAALDVLLTRVPLGQTPSHLRSVRRGVAQIRDELRDPDNSGVSASTATRERRVESIVTPPTVREARARAVVRGEDPAAAVVFSEQGYYDHLMAAVHQCMLDDWSWAEPLDSRAPMDVRPGGHVEGIAGEAKARVDAIFGAYGSAGAPSLTFASGTLVDQTQTAGRPDDLIRWYIFDSGREAVRAVKDAHSAFASDRANEIGMQVVQHYVGNPAGAVPVPGNLGTALGMAAAERVRRLTIIDRMWGGMQEQGRVSVRPRVGANPRETRAQYWALFKTLIHEYLHTTAHASYNAWYDRLTDPHQKIVYQEGFTDLFTRQTWNSVFPDHITSSSAFRRTIQGEDALDMAAVGRAPHPYDEIEQAAQIERQIGVANMRAGYFRGNTAVLGGARLPREP